MVRSSRAMARSVTHRKVNLTQRAEVQTQEAISSEIDRSRLGESPLHHHSPQHRFQRAGGSLQ